MLDNVTQIERADLHADPDNVNIHDDENLAMIRASIERFGFLDPIGVVPNPDRAAGGYMVVEGHGRLIVAMQAKMSPLPCIVLTLEEAERRGYAIAHNNIQRINSLNLDAVSAEFSRLGVTEDDYPSLGFTAEDGLFLMGMGGGLGAGTGDKFSAPDGGEYEEQEQKGSDAGSGGTWGQFVPAVHRSEMRFASDTSLNRFVALLNLLRGHYPLAETHAERLTLLLRDKGLISAAPVETADAAA